MVSESHSGEVKVVVHRVSFATLITIFLALFIVGYSLLKAKQRNEIVLYEQGIYDRVYFENQKLATESNVSSIEPPSLRTTVYRKPAIRDLSKSDFIDRQTFMARQDKQPQDSQ